MKTLNTYFFNKLTPTFALPLIVLTSVLLLFGYISILQPKPIFLGGTLFLLIFLAVIVYRGFFSRKVRIAQNEIEFIGINKRFYIKWADVESFGVFIQNNHGAIPLQGQKINERTILGQKFIYVTSKKYPNLQNINKNGFICFQYRKEAYEAIVAKINER